MYTSSCYNTAINFAVITIFKVLKLKQFYLNNQLLFKIIILFIRYINYTHSSCCFYEFQILIILGLLFKGLGKFTIVQL